MASLKKITRRGVIGLGLTALVLAGATVINNLMPVNRIELKDRAAVKVDLNEARRETLYKAIIGYNEEFYNGTKSYGGNFEGYVDFMAQGSLWQGYSNEIKKSIDFYAQQNNGDKGKGKEIVVEGYVNLQKMCLDLAVSKIDSEVSEKDIDECAERLVIHMRKIAKITPIDYQHPAVKEAYKTFARERVNFFRNIMVNSGLTRNTGLGKKELKIRKTLDESRNVEDVEGRSLIFKKVLKDLYTKERFENEILEYENARKPLYASFGKSLENSRGSLSIFIRTFGPAIARRTGERSDEINRKEVDRIFQQDADGAKK